MSTLQLDISDDLVQLMGLSEIQSYLQKRLELLKLQLLADKLGTAIQETNLDWEHELEVARQQAWDEYKKGKL